MLTDGNILALQFEIATVKLEAVKMLFIDILLQRIVFLVTQIFPVLFE